MVCRVVLTDRDERFVDGVRGALGHADGVEVVPATSAATARELALHTDTEVVVLGPSIAVEASLSIASEFMVSAPRIAVIIVVPRVTTDLLRQALRAGVRDVLSVEDQTYPDIAAAINASCSQVSARAEAGSSPPCTPAKLGRVVTVFSTKGGVGKSVIATNLAVALARGHDRRVILVDLDFESSDVAVMLNTQPVHTIVDAAVAINRLDLDMLDGMLVTHPSGARALLAPVRPEDAEVISVAKVLRTIELLRQMCDVVVIDTPPYLNENVMAALSVSSVVLGIATMEMTSVKNMRVAIQKFRALGFQEGLVHLVLNRADSKVLLEVSDIEKALGMSTYARIPNDRNVPRSINKGMPIVADEPRSPFSKAVVTLAAKLAAEEEV